MAPTLCQKVRGCCHPPGHTEPCEINARQPSKPAIAAAVSFLDDQQAIAQLAGRAADELLIIVGANSVLFSGGLNRDAIDLLVQAKCGWSANRKEIPLSTVKIVLDALGRLGEYLNDAPPAQKEEASNGKKRR